MNVQLTRQEQAARGRTLREKLGIDEHVHGGGINDYPGFVDEAIFGVIWSREGLELNERMMATLCAITALEREVLVAPYVRSAVHLGIEPVAIEELMLQASLYAGFAASESAARIAREVFDAEGVTVSARQPLPQDLSAAGQEKMAELHGERSTQGYASPDNATTGPLYSIAIDYGYGFLWQRDGLSVRERFICSIASFTALGLDTQVAKFAASAEREHLSRAEVVEVIMQVAPYNGFPRSLNALALIDAGSG